MNGTRTHTTYFDTDRVDELLGAAHRELESDYERRREHMSSDARRGCEARLGFLRAAWTLLLDRVAE